MKKNKILIASIIAVAVLFAGILTAMFATGRFDSLKSAYENEPTVFADIEVTEPTTVLNVGRPKSVIPESIVAAVYSEYKENYSVELARFEELGMNTVIFELTESNASAVASMIETVKALNVFHGIKADISVKSDYVTDFVESVNFDFTILSGSDETIGTYAESTAKLCDKIKAIDPAMHIGIEPTISSKASDSVIMLTESGKADFVYLCHTAGKESVFETAQNIWNEESCNLWLSHDLSGISSYSTDKASETIEMIKTSADMSLCKALVFGPYTEISNANGTSAEIVKNYIKERDTYLLDKEFTVNSHKNTKITVEQSKITFRGTSSPAFDLTCNGQKLNVAKTGDFSVDCDLTPGTNKITFEHKGKTYTYTVTYKIKLLKSVSPTEDLNVSDGMEIEFKAVALKKADVSLTLNGKTYKMTQTSNASNDDESPDKDSDFTTFSAFVTAPGSTSSAQKLGKFKVTAKYSGLTESLSGANVTVKAKEVPVTQPPTTAAPTTTTTTEVQTTSTESTSAENGESTSALPGGETANVETTAEPVAESTTEDTTIYTGERLEKYYYTKDYGLGSARICEITDNYVEVFPGKTTSTRSIPDCSPLLKTTVDYVIDENRFDGEKFYILASGVKVPLQRTERLASGKNGSITHLSVKNGYRMPQNSIKVVYCGTTDNKTVIKLDMNRPVAFNAKILGQSYSDFDGRLVRVSSLTCNALQFVFSDTVKAEGNITVSNALCTGGTWTTDNNSTVTLTLQLAKSGKFYGFHYEYDKDGYLVISMNHKPASLSGYTIMLDPGHGGVDSGAVCAVSSKSYGYEKQINLSIATKIKDLLEAEGADVIMTRTSDTWVCYTDRNEAVRKQNPDMFIAVHCDSTTSASSYGTSAFYYRAYSQPLAAAVHDSIVNAYKTKIYSGKSESFKNGISRTADFYPFRVTRVEECPAILVEYGFVSNTNECQVLQTAKNRDILAEATVEGIKKYISAS